MTLRIFAETDSDGGVISLHGRLSAAEVPEVERALAVGPSARLDLACLSGVDAAGLAVLRRLRKDGTCLTGVSPYIELRLEQLRGEEPEEMKAEQGRRGEGE